MVTGDIAWSGKPKEYEQATRFFHELNKEVVQKLLGVTRRRSRIGEALVASG